MGIFNIGDLVQMRIDRQMYRGRLTMYADLGLCIKIGDMRCKVPERAKLLRISGPK